MAETLQTVSENDLELHPESARQRQETYSSLTDIHNIQLFSDEFEKSVEGVKNKKAEEENQLIESIFVEDMTEAEDTDEWLVSQLFMGQEEQVLKQDYTKMDIGLSVMDAGIVIIAVLLVIAVYLFLFSDKRTRRKKI